MTEDGIIAALQSSDDQLRRNALRALYTDPDLRKKAFHYVLGKTGDADLARDCFQFALMTAEEKIRLNLYQRRASLHTYILGIVKWHLINERRKSNRTIPFDPDIHAPADSPDDIEDYPVHPDRLRLLQTIIQHMSARCRELLMRWACNATPQELCVEFGFSNPEMARKETYRCRLKIRAYVNQRDWLKKELKPD